MDQDTGYRSDKKQYQESPVGEMRVFAFFVLFFDPENRKINHSDDQAECSIITKQSLGMIPAIYGFGLKSSQKPNNQWKQDHIT